MVAKVWTPSFSFPWPLPAMLQCVQVPGDWCQEHQPSWISLITIRCFFLLLKLLLCVFLCPADTAGPTFLFARERRVAVFIGSGVKPPPSLYYPVALTASVSGWFLPLWLFCCPGGLGEDFQLVLEVLAGSGIWGPGQGLGGMAADRQQGLETQLVAHPGDRDAKSRLHWDTVLPDRLRESSQITCISERHISLPPCWERTVGVSVWRRLC